MPLQFWWDAFLTATLLINALPSSVLLDKSLMEHLLNPQLNLNELRIFGFACYSYLRPYNAHKFQFKSEHYAYLGPSWAHKGNKCLLSNGGVIIYRYVQFNGEVFPFAAGFSDSLPLGSNTAFTPSGPAYTNWFFSLVLPFQRGNPTHSNEPSP